MQSRTQPNSDAEYIASAQGQAMGKMVDKSKSPHRLQGVLGI